MAGGESAGLLGELAGGDEERDVRSVFAACGAVELLQVRASDGAVLRVALALHHELPSVRQPARHIGAQVVRRTHTAHLGTSIPATQLRDILLELPRVHRPDRLHRPDGLDPRLLCQPRLLRFRFAAPRPNQDPHQAPRSQDG